MLILVVFKMRLCLSENTGPENASIDWIGLAGNYVQMSRIFRHHKHEQYNAQCIMNTLFLLYSFALAPRASLMGATSTIILPVFTPA